MPGYGVGERQQVHLVLLPFSFLPLDTSYFLLEWFVDGRCAWLQRRGGLEAIGRHNQEQAGRLYARLDQDSRFRGLADPMARSLMNVTFTSGDSDSDQRFLATCRRAGLVGLAGHRSVGGLRASLYNALPDEAVDRLLEAIDDFETDSAE